MGESVFTRFAIEFSDRARFEIVLHHSRHAEVRVHRASIELEVLVVFDGPAHVEGHLLRQVRPRVAVARERHEHVAAREQLGLARRRKKSSDGGLIVGELERRGMFLELGAELTDAVLENLAAERSVRGIVDRPGHDAEVRLRTRRASAARGDERSTNHEESAHAHLTPE